MATEKNRKFAALIVPFSACPFEKVEEDCPFIDFWKLEGLEQQLQAMDKLPEQKLTDLREHHNMCRNRKIQGGEPMVNI